MRKLTLISHVLCPYVQRAAIALSEKGVPFDRIDIDLADKPDWFIRLSPLGKVPVLKVEQDGVETVLFESAVIVEYLEETAPNPLHPSDPLDRARARSWMEYGSAMLAAIAGFYGAKDDTQHQERAEKLRALLARLEPELREGPFFDGDRFSLVDTVYGPIFRYFDLFEAKAGLDLAENLPKLAVWRSALRARDSVRHAVSADYPHRLEMFLLNRPGPLAEKIRNAA